MTARKKEKRRSVEGPSDDGTERPALGDVVVVRASQTRPRYVIGLAGTPLQISYPRYEEAIDRALQFAARTNVDAWYTYDDRRFTPLGRYRPRQG